MKTASSAPIQISASPSEGGRPDSSEYERAVLAVNVTGEASANVRSQSGIPLTGTKTDDANTSGNITTNPADWAASAPRTISATNAKIQLRARPKPLTTRIAATACTAPPWKRKP